MEDLKYAGLVDDSKEPQWLSNNRPLDMDTAKSRAFGSSASGAGTSAFVDETSVRLFLIRHGQAPGNVTGALDTDVPGPDLTDVGIRQAQELSANKSLEEVSAIYHSTMRRAAQTAAPLAARLDIQLIARGGLREIGAGELNMRNDPEALGRYHAFMQKCAIGVDAYLAGAETSSQVVDRFDRVVAEILRSRHSNVAIISHSAVMRAWTGRRVKNLDADFVMANRITNIGLIVLDSDKRGVWTALTWNSVAL